MRNSFDIILNPSLKSILSSALPILPQVPTNSIIRISQSNNQLYLKYNPDVSLIKNHNTRSSMQGQLPEKMLILNGFKTGVVQYEAVFPQPGQCKKLTIYVNKLDWQIINNKVQMLQQQIMNQINIVWQNARVPIYYDNNNCVTVRVKIQNHHNLANSNNNVGILVQNSQLQVLVDEQQQNTNVQQKKNKKKEKQQFNCNKLRILPASMAQSGNINKIYISKNHPIFNYYKKQQYAIDSQKGKQSSKVSQASTLDTNNQLGNKNSSENSVINVNDQQMNDKYFFYLNYQPLPSQVTKREQKRRFPCDTNILSVKQQISIIRDSKVKSNANNESNTINKKQGQNKPKTNTKIQKLLVQVHKIDDNLLNNLDVQKLKQITFNDVHSPIQDQIEQHKQQSQLQYRAHSPTPKPNSLNNQPNDTIYMNEYLIENYQINTQKQSATLKIQMIIKQQESATKSKKLQYLLKLKQLKICVVIAQKKQNYNLAVQQQIIQHLLQHITYKLTTNQQQQHDTIDTNITNSLTLFSKIPYLINIKSSGTHKFSYIYIKQSDSLIGDPLTIINTINREQLKKYTSNKQKSRKYDLKNKQEESMRKSDNFQKQKKEVQNQEHLQEYRQYIRSRIRQVVKISNYYYDDQNRDQIAMKLAILNKINQFAYKNINELSQLNVKQMIQMNKSEIETKGSKHKTNQQIFIDLYKICYEQQINKVIRLLINHQQDTRPILISSFSNNGKTIMNKIIRQHFANNKSQQSNANQHDNNKKLNNISTLYIDMSQFDSISLTLPQLSQYLQLAFQLSQHNIIFMDNLDSVCYRIDKGDQHRKQQRVASKLILRRILNYSRKYQKMCIFTAKNQTNIDQQFKEYLHIVLRNPNRQLRHRILSKYHSMTSINNIQKESTNINESIIEQTEQNQRVEQNEVNDKKFNDIVQQSESMSFGQFSKYLITGHKQQNINVSNNESVVNFRKLAGIKQVKKILRGVVQRPLKYSFVFKKLPIKLSRGVLLYGGSGTGKSAIGEALAGEFKMKFFSIKGSDILSKYIGGSEAAVRQVFEKAMSVSPSIIFFDQFQSITPRRNASNTGVTDRVVNQFLTYLDGVASVDGVYIVAASSRPQLIDPALLRPGRIDTHIFLDYPNQQQRQQLFQLYSRSITFQSSKQQIVKLTQGYSYSDLIGLIKQLRIKQSAKIIKQSASSLLNEKQAKIDSSKFKYITKQFLMQILKQYRVALTKQQKIKEKKKLMMFKNGQAPDISKQKTILQ